MDNTFNEHAIRCRPRMVQVARRIGLSLDEAYDVVDELLWGRLRDMAPRLEWSNPDSIMGYFCQAAKRAAMLHIRSEINRRGRQGAYNQKLETPPSVDRGYSLDEQIMVHKALNTLPKEDAEIAWKVWALQFSYKEVAAEYGLTVNQLIGRLFNKIKPALKLSLSSMGAGPIR